MISAIGAPPAHIIAQQGVQPTEAKDPGKKITLEVSPKEGNVESGDKSQNSAQVQLTTPSNEYSTELTREQAVSSVQFRMTQNALDRSGVVEGNNSSPIKKAALVESGALESDTAQNVVAGRQANAAIDTYQNVADNSIYNDDSDDESAQQKYSEASSAYIKQSLFFEKTEDIGFSITA